MPGPDPVMLVLAADSVPLGLKLAMTAVAAVMLPVYLREFGWRRFLWFSNVTLALAVVGAWSESALLLSMAALCGFLPYLAWEAMFFGHLLLGGKAPSGQHFFDPAVGWPARLVTLFHVPMPAVLLYLVWRVGYDGGALVWQSALGVAVLIATYALTDPADNTNFVHTATKRRLPLPPPAWLAMMCVLVPTLVYLPTHLLLSAWFDGRR